MSYRIEEVDQVLTCEICSKIYENPRLLPCSESACNKCIQKIIERNPEKKFDCNFCHEKHTPSGKEGFPLNGALIKLLKTKVDVKNKDDVKPKVDKVYRDVHVNELTEKLEEIKNKCEQFKFSLDNGVDQLREHCIRLRNQVHLETDILIEEAHTFNESLIAEINKYEKECIDSFKSKTSQKDNEFDAFIAELAEFHSDKTKHLTEFENYEKVVGEAYEQAGDYLIKLEMQEKSLKKTQFNGKVAEFRKCQIKHNRTLLGTLTYKSVNFDTRNLNQLSLDNEICKNFSKGINIFKHDDGNFYAFYRNKSYHLNMTSFGDDGKVIKQNVNVFNYNGDKSSYEVNTYAVAHSSNGFVIYVKMFHGNKLMPTAIFGHTININTGVTVNSLLMKIDRNFTYVNHQVNMFSNELKHVATNSSNILCVDSEFKYYFLDMNLAALRHKILNVCTSQVGNAIVDVQMSDKYAFFLCNLSKLKIFEIESGSIVKAIDTSANQIKLASTNCLYLFNSSDRILHVHEKTEEFCKLEDLIWPYPLRMIS
jgi:hypothetical protein